MKEENTEFNVYDEPSYDLYEGPYPTHIEIISDMDRKYVKNGSIKVLVPGNGAIKVKIDINSQSYKKSDIKKGLAQVFEQILKNYD